MRNLLFLVLIVVMAGSGFAQEATSTPLSEKEIKRQKKEQEKAEKQRQKDEKVRSESEAAMRTVSLKALQTFPKDYLDKPLRVEAVALDEIKAHTEGNNTAYIMALESDNARTTAFLLYGEVTFIVIEEALARAVFAQIAEIPEGYRKIVNVWFMMKVFSDADGRPYYAAKVNCVEFRNWKGGVSRTIGTCPSF